MLNPKARETKLITKLGKGSLGRNAIIHQLTCGESIRKKTVLIFFTSQCTDLSDKSMEMSTPTAAVPGKPRISARQTPAEGWSRGGILAHFPRQAREGLSALLKRGVPAPTRICVLSAPTWAEAGHSKRTSSRTCFEHIPREAALWSQHDHSHP